MRMRSFGPRRFQGGGAAAFPVSPQQQALAQQQTAQLMANNPAAASLFSLPKPPGFSSTPLGAPPPGSMGMPPNVMAGMQAAARMGNPAGGGNAMTGLTGGGPGSTMNQAALPNQAAAQAALAAQMNRLRSAGVPPAAGGVPPALPAPAAPGMAGMPPRLGPGTAGIGVAPGMGAGIAGQNNLAALQTAQLMQNNPAAASLFAGAQPSMAGMGTMGMARGGKVLDADSDTPAKKNRPARQWGNVKEEAAPVVTKLARGGNITVRRPPKPKAKMAAPPKKPVPTPSPYDYEADEGTAPTALASGPGGTPPLAGPGMAKGGKWIQKAVKHPGALHKQLGVPQGQKIPAKKLASAAKAPGKLGQRARLAETLKGMKKNKGGACDDKKMAKGGKFDSTANLPASRKKFAAGGAAKERKGFPNTTPPPKPKAFAEGGKVRGCGIATKGCNFSGIY